MKHQTVALLGCVVLACDSPFEPQGRGERVAVGQIITDAMNGDSVRRYSFDASVAGAYVVFLEALEGTISLIVSDSARPGVSQSIAATPASGSLEQNASRYLQMLPAGVGLLRVMTLPPGSAGRFRFKVYLVNTAPETRPPRFAIGDTVSGETIDPVADADDFVTSGAAGQEVVAMVQALGPAGSGPVGLVVVDPLTNDVLGLAAHDPTLPRPSTTGLMRFPAARDYRFSFSALFGSLPRYQGPYRFWTYPIDRKPEHHGVGVAVDSEVRGESIDLAGDVDEFEFSGLAGMELSAFLQSTHPFQLEVAPLSGAPIAILRTGGSADTSLFHLSTGRFQLNQTGTYLVRVMGIAAYDLADTGAFRFFLYPIDRRPESITAGVNPIDTIAGEAIDRAGDVDEFTFPGTVGETFNAFLQAQNGSTQTLLQLEAVDANSSVLSTALSDGSDTSLTHQQTGRFSLATSGTHRLRVSGVVSTIDRDTGGFRLLLYPINRQPEAAPDSLVFGDSVFAESVNAPGDIDEFRVTVSDTSGANLVARIDSGAVGSLLDASLVDSAGQTTATALSFSPGALGQTGAITLLPGTYTLRVQGQSFMGDDRSDLVGGYGVWLYRFRFGPEVALDTIGIGDTITSEALDPPGDFDQFWFSGKRGDHVNLALEGQAAPSAGGFGATLFGPGPSGQFLGSVSSPTQPDSLGPHQTGRIDLPVDGLYHITVSGGSSPPQFFETGSYRFALTRRSIAPEHVGAALVPGDSVITEAIDTPDDWDEFTLTGTSGQLLTIVARTTDPAPVGYPLIAVFDSVTTDTVAWTAAQGFDKPSGYFTMPASGRLKIAVYHPTFGFGGDFLGGYRFVVVAVNPAPENAPATFALGDTVQGEAVFPAMDVDEFTSTATPGDTLAPLYRLLSDPVPSGRLITLLIVDPATGVVLVGMGVSLIAASPQFTSPGSFVVPPGGAYVVRVRGGGFGGEQLGTAPYEFFVRPGP